VAAPPIHLKPNHCSLSPLLRLPPAVAARLQALLDRQDSGQPLTSLERDEAEGLVNLAELLTLLRLRAERTSR
jgi:hypothetical protein